MLIVLTKTVYLFAITMMSRKVVVVKMLLPVSLLTDLVPIVALLMKTFMLLIWLGVGRVLILFQALSHQLVS